MISQIENQGSPRLGYASQAELERFLKKDADEQIGRIHVGTLYPLDAQLMAGTLFRRTHQGSHLRAASCVESFKGAKAGANYAVQQTSTGLSVKELSVLDEEGSQERIINLDTLAELLEGQEKGGEQLFQEYGSAVMKAFINNREASLAAETTL